MELNSNLGTPKIMELLFGFFNFLSLSRKLDFKNVMRLLHTTGYYLPQSPKGN